MTLDVFIPAIGQQELLDQTIQHLVDNDVLDSTWYYVIDNGSKTPLQSEIADVIRNEENLGMVGSLRQAMEYSDAEILIYLHSDMLIFEPGWDTQLIEAFESDPKLAALGVVGAVQADSNGGRSGTVCAFRDGHLHGSKPSQHITPVALLDGCFMALRRAYLENFDWDTLEENGYLFSYDKGLTLALTMQSLHVGVIDFDSQHLGGRTSCQTEFHDTLKEKGSDLDSMYRDSERRYIERWKDTLPVRVRSDWHVDVGVRR
jgi:glycosyltransferase involved in cell wall biosynthesis